jgi:peptidoglycan/xylan/chitin deacetylase (PgdA/CDA1 family)
MPVTVNPDRRWRWYAKKAARRCLAMYGSVAADSRLHRPRVHVLTYHRFSNVRYDPFAVAPAVFADQMRWLHDRKLAVSLADVLDFLRGGAELPDGAVLVTIDDGEPCLYEHAVPILSAYAIPAVAFVPAGELTGPRSGHTNARSDRVTWEQLIEASKAGLTVGSHAWSHESLGRLPALQVRHQAQRSREMLEQMLGKPVTAFAYPFGTRADYGPRIAAVLRECGYECAFTSQHGALVPGSDPFELPRIKIEGGDPTSVFHAACAGYLDAWRWIDRTLWRLQASPGAVRPTSAP